MRRLADEIPLGVKEKHIEILRQIRESAEFEDKEGYRNFKAEYISKRLKDESTRPLMDKICQLYGGTAFSLLFLGGLNDRLRTFLGDSIDEKRTIDKRLEMTSIPDIEIPSDTRWEDIKLAFLDHEELQIFIKNRPRAVKNYISLGLADRRTEKTGLEKSKPNRLWRTLALFARTNGEISWDDTHHSELYTLVKNVSDLRKHLKAVFRISSSPIGSYKRGKMTIYRTKFIISPMDKELFDRIANLVGAIEEYQTTRAEKPDADEDENS